LHISGLVSYRHLDFVMSFLERDVPKVQDVSLRNFTSGAAELGVAYGGSTSDLARRLANQPFTGFRLEPTHVASGRIDLKTVLQR